MDKTHALPVIEVSGPCPADWDAMSLVDGGRFCSQCQRVVHDLSAMTSSEVHDLICREAGRLCVRFERAEDGAAKTLDYQPIDGRRRWTRRWSLTGGVVALLAGCANVMWWRSLAAPVPTIMLGKMAPPTTQSVPLMGSVAPPAACGKS